jgi:hypothetical protein
MYKPQDISISEVAPSYHTVHLGRNVMKRISGMAVFFALLCLASNAFSQGVIPGDFHVYWPGGKWPPSGAGGGGIFHTQLREGAVVPGNPTSGALITQYSFCVETRQNIAAGNNYNVSLIRLTEMNAAELANNTLGTFGPPEDNTTIHLARDANRGGIAYLMNKYLWATVGMPNGAAKNAQAAGLQGAMWYLWGFNSGYNDAGVIGTEEAGDEFQSGFLDPGTFLSGPVGNQFWNLAAHNFVKEALLYSPNVNNQYRNSAVLWAHSPVIGQNSPRFQDQVFITPEGSSLALLLPGLIPVAIVIRRRSRKA